LVFSPLKNVLAIGTDRGLVEVWDVDAGEVCFNTAGESNLDSPNGLSEIAALAFSPHHKDLLLSAYSSGNVVFTDTNQRSASLSASKTGTSATVPGVIKTIRTNRCLTSLSYCPDGIRLACGTIDEGVLLYDLRKTHNTISESK